VSRFDSREQALREMRYGAFVLRGLALGFLVGAAFDEPIERWVIVAAIICLLVSEAGMAANLYYRWRPPERHLSPRRHDIGRSKESGNDSV